MPSDPVSDDGVLQMHITRAHMQIGHDAIHMLNGFGRVTAQSPYGLWNTLIQAGKDGAVQRSLSLRLANPSGHFIGTYGTFLTSFVFPTAEELAGRLKRTSEAKRTALLADLVEKSEDCSRTHWILSANSVRRFLYPGAYDGNGPRQHRTDRLFYVPREDDDVFRTGSFITPEGLDRASVDEWKAKVSREFPLYDVDRFGPITA